MKLKLAVFLKKKLNGNEIISFSCILNEAIACLMDDADSYEFERLSNEIICSIASTSVEKFL